MILSTLSLLALSGSSAATPVRRTDANQAKISVQRDGGFATYGPQYGYMFEDISHSGDGGLYPELLQNRAFQIVDPANQTKALYAWHDLKGSSISVINSTSPISTALPNSLAVSPNGSFENEGYWGMKIDSNWTYAASFYAKLASSNASSPSVTVSLVSNTSGTTFDSFHVSNLTSEWQKFEATLSPSQDAENLNNTFRVTLEGSGTDGEVYFGMFSLFPPTYKGRKNGLRTDVETLLSTKPSILRWGGNNIEGLSIDSRWRWNETIGPIESRPGRQGNWGYINTDGLGLMEFLLLSEDLGTDCIMSVWAGFALGLPAPAIENTIQNASLLAPYVQEALDQIEFVVGNVSTKYGALRAELGHPEPFNVPWIEIGNEDFFASESYVAYRWKTFHNAIAAAYPDLKLISTTLPAVNLTPKAEYNDGHIYETPQWFFNASDRYNDFDRSTKHFELEYAAISTNDTRVDADLFQPVEANAGRLRWSTMEAAIGEAAYMTGLEKNSDFVVGAAFAPMIENRNDNDWSPNLISLDAGRVYNNSASFYVQKIFSIHRGDSVLPSSISSNFNDNSTIRWVASHSSITNETFVKVANFDNSSVSLSIDLSSFPSTSNTSLVDYVYSTTGGAKDFNTPTEGGPVQNVQANLSVEAGVVEWLMPGWSAAVFAIGSA